MYVYMQAAALEELSVQRGERLEVLDDSLKWWKVKNVYGATGYIPASMLEVQIPKAKKSSSRST